MRRTTALFTLGATVLATALAGVALPATASEEVRAVSSSEQAASLDYWTPERMAQAKQIGGVVDGTAAPHLEAGPEMAWRHLPFRKAGSGPAQVPQSASAVKGSAWTKSGRVTKTVGKVFFKLPSGDYTCTATSVDSANKSTLITAGHCVYQQGAYASNWVFVPASKNGSAPYGRWTPSKMYPSPQWVANGDVNHDYAFVTLKPRKNKRLATQVGSLPVSFTSRTGTPLTSFGYSGAAPYYGSRLVYCQGGVMADSFGGTRAEGQPCTMIAGASGGPRLTNFNGSTGAVAAVNSFTYSSGPSEPVLWATRLGPEARTLYSQASR